ncbi:hypothetical protein BBO01nite_45400 [Brevibacillus borstelensis]|nr:hypothetical protein BBO01nite_45400 [Brevibacillus borstelensis]
MIDNTFLNLRLRLKLPPTSQFLKFIEYMQPEFGRLILSNPVSKHILMTVKVNANHHIGGFIRQPLK